MELRRAAFFYRDDVINACPAPGFVSRTQPLPLVTAQAPKAR